MLQQQKKPSARSRRRGRPTAPASSASSTSPGPLPVLGGTSPASTTTTALAAAAVVLLAVVGAASGPVGAGALLVEGGGDRGVGDWSRHRPIDATDEDDEVAIIEPGPPVSLLETARDRAKEEAAAGKEVLREAFASAESAERAGGRRFVSLLARARQGASTAVEAAERKGGLGLAMALGAGASTSTRAAEMFTIVGLAVMVVAAGMLVFLWVSMHSQDESGPPQYKSALMEGGSNSNLVVGPPGSNPQLNSAASLGYDPRFETQSSPGTNPGMTTPVSGNRPPPPAMASQQSRRAKGAPCC